MITVSQLQRELAKLIEAGKGHVEVCVDETAITGLFYMDGEAQAFDAADATSLILETGSAQ